MAPHTQRFATYDRFDAHANVVSSLRCYSRKRGVAYPNLAPICRAIGQPCEHLFQTGRFQLGEGDELSVIAAAVLGGASLFGGLRAKPVHIRRLVMLSDPTSSA